MAGHLLGSQKCVCGKGLSLACHHHGYLTFSVWNREEHLMGNLTPHENRLAALHSCPFFLGPGPEDREAGRHQDRLQAGGNGTTPSSFIAISYGASGVCAGCALELSSWHLWDSVRLCVQRPPEQLRDPYQETVLTVSHVDLTKDQESRAGFQVELQPEVIASFLETGEILFEANTGRQRSWCCSFFCWRHLLSCPWSHHQDHLIS